MSVEIEQSPVGIKFQCGKCFGFGTHHFTEFLDFTTVFLKVMFILQYLAAALVLEIRTHHFPCLGFILQNSVFCSKLFCLFAQ